MANEAGPGRKQCPQCQNFVGVRTCECICGFVFKKRATAPVVEKTTPAGAGKGRKQCPGCQTYVGVRTGVCSCGYHFNENKPIQEAKTPEPIAKTQPTKEIRRVVPSFDEYLVLTPAGKCPVPFKGDVVSWVQELCSQRAYTAQALKYWLKTLVTAEEYSQLAFQVEDCFRPLE